MNSFGCFRALGGSNRKALFQAGTEAGIPHFELVANCAQWLAMMERARQPDYFPKACRREMDAGYSLKQVLDEFQDSGLY